MLELLLVEPEGIYRDFKDKNGSQTGLLNLRKFEEREHLGKPQDSPPFWNSLEEVRWELDLLSGRSGRFSPVLENDELGKHALRELFGSILFDIPNPIIRALGNSRYIIECDISTKLDFSSPLNIPNEPGEGIEITYPSPRRVVLKTKEATDRGYTHFLKDLGVFVKKLEHVLNELVAGHLKLELKDHYQAYGFVLPRSFPLFTDFLKEQCKTFESVRNVEGVPVPIAALSSDWTKDYCGKTVGLYEVGKVVAKGGLARIFEATKIKRNYVLRVARTGKIGSISSKEMRAFLITEGEDKAFLNQLEVYERLREFRSEKKRQDKRIDGHFLQEDAGIFENGDCYIASRRLEGNLYDHLKSAHSPTGPDGVVRHYADALDGLSLLHELGVIHRDLHPQNLLVNNEKIYLADFDLAVCLGPGELAKLKDGKLVDIQSIGSQRVNAPEVYKKKIGFCSDLFSLAVNLYTSLTGRIPFTGEVENFASLLRTPDPDDPEGDYGRKKREIAAKVIDPLTYNCIQHPTTVVKYIPRELGDAVMKGLSFDHRNRYQNADEFKAALMKFTV